MRERRNFFPSLYVSFPQKDDACNRKSPGEKLPEQEQASNSHLSYSGIGASELPKAT